MAVPRTPDPASVTNIIPFPTPDQLPDAPALPNLPGPPSLRIGTHGGAGPRLPRFARGRPPRPPFSPPRPGETPSTTPLPAPQALPPKVKQAAPQAGAVTPGTEIPRGVGELQKDQPSGRERLKQMASKLNPSARQSVREMAQQHRAEQEARAKRAEKYQGIDATLDALRQAPAAPPPAPPPPAPPPPSAGGQP